MLKHFKAGFEAGFEVGFEVGFEAGSNLLFLNTFKRKTTLSPDGMTE